MIVHRLIKNIFFSQDTPQDVEVAWLSRAVSGALELRVYDDGEWKLISGSGGGGVSSTYINNAGHLIVNSQDLGRVVGYNGQPGNDGHDGQNGQDGRDGLDAAISEVTATVGSNTGTPTVEVTLGGTAQNRTIQFNFDGLKGIPGSNGHDGVDGERGADGADGIDGVDGKDGVGILSIEKTGTLGLVDTYTITLTNGNTATFTITNGTDGLNGTDGIGIWEIEKVSTVGLVDTYAIVLTNGERETFTVTNGQSGLNGARGSDGIDGINGIDGEDGSMWFVGTDISQAGSYNLQNSKVGDLYLNTDTYDIFRQVNSNQWQQIGNIKGAPGTSDSNGVNWYTGTDITGTGLITYVISGVNAGDMYLNTSTKELYRATTATTWLYLCTTQIIYSAGTGLDLTGDTFSLEKATDSTLGGIEADTHDDPGDEYPMNAFVEVKFYPSVWAQRDRNRLAINLNDIWNCLHDEDYPIFSGVKGINVTFDSYSHEVGDEAPQYITWGLNHLTQNCAGKFCRGVYDSGNIDIEWYDIPVLSNLYHSNEISYLVTGIGTEIGGTSIIGSESQYYLNGLGAWTKIDYTHLLNTPTIPAAQIQSDWNQANNEALDYIKNKPTIPAAQIQSDWNQSNSAALDFIKNKPTIPPDTPNIIVCDYDASYDLVFNVLNTNSGMSRTQYWVQKNTYFVPNSSDELLVGQITVDDGQGGTTTANRDIVINWDSSQDSPLDGEAKIFFHTSSAGKPMLYFSWDLSLIEDYSMHNDNSPEFVEDIVGWQLQNDAYYIVTICRDTIQVQRAKQIAKTQVSEIP